MDDRYYIGFYQKDMLIAVLDLIDSHKYHSVRLAWVDGNLQAEHFWRKNNFTPIKKTKSNVADKAVLAERVLNQPL